MTNETSNSDFSFAAPLWLDEVSSTNDYLKKMAADDAETLSGTVVAARRQTGGRGRMGGTWLSSREGDLTFSFLWKGRVSLEQAGTLPIACALGVGDFLAAPNFGIAIRCKWPNDVMVGDAKICGILTEGVAGLGNALALVMGIGVNIRAMPERDTTVGRATTSLEDMIGCAGRQDALLPTLLRCLETRIIAWQGGGFTAIRKDYEKSLWGVGRAVAVKRSTGAVKGVIRGVGENGELILSDDTGAEVIVTSVSTLDYEAFSE